MSTDADDIAIARQLSEAGIATPDQIAKGLAAQGLALQQGKQISLAEALLRAGILTSAQKESVEKVARRQRGRIQELGPFRLKRKLGEGGMGAVYLAEDSRDGRRLALKVLPRNLAADPEYVQRFRREIDAAKKLQHPSIVRAFESGEDLGYFFYVMEYCEGESLEAALKRQGLIPWHRALQIVRDVAQGLDYAHKSGFVHRDIKPANVFITVANAAKILDLGLAKRIDESQASFKTVTGTVLGTPHYISPEQARGEKVVDGRADIYSLGAMLYHVITGEVPFTGNSVYEILDKHVHSELPNPQDIAEDIPDGVVSVLQKMMAKDVLNRYANCDALGQDVDLVLAGKSPEGAMLKPGDSSVATPRKQSDRVRRKRAGTYRSPKPTVPQEKRKLLLWGGSVAAVAVVAMVWLLSGAPSSTRVFDQWANQARAEKDPTASLALWKKAEAVVETSADRTEARRHIDELSARVSRLQGAAKTDGSPSAKVSQDPSVGMRRLLLDDFELGVFAWTYSDGREFPGAKGALVHDPDVGHAGKGSLRLKADFTAGGSYVSGGRNLPPRSDLKELRFWLRGDVVTNLGIRVEDSSGQVHQKPVPLTGTRDWQEVIVSFEKVAGGDHWGGANDGKWHGPVKAFQICPNVASFARAKSGEIWLDDLEGILNMDSPDSKR